MRWIASTGQGANIIQDKSICSKTAWLVWCDLAEQSYQDAKLSDGVLRATQKDDMIDRRKA